MAPIEDLQARDLAWISDFVMQQMVIMMRPIMEHLQQTDASVDYAHRLVQRVSMDVSEVRGDVERTNKYLAILRQGLGVQNEGKCVLQRGLEGTARTVKRLDDQMESMLGVVRSVEESISQLCSDVRGTGLKQEDMSKQIANGALSVECLQEKVERITHDAHTIKDSLLNSEAKMEVWQRELRELRRSHMNLMPKLEEKAGRVAHSSQPQANGREPWPQKKAPFASPMDEKGGVPYGDSCSNRSGSSQHSKRISRVGSGSRGSALKEDADFGAPVRSSSRAAAAEGQDADEGGHGEDPLLGHPGAREVQSRLSALEERLSVAWEQLQASREANHGDAARLERRLEAQGGELAGLRKAVGELAAGEAHTGGSKLPLLGAKQPGGVSRPERGSAEGPRLRFTATMATPPSRGSPN